MLESGGTSVVVRYLVTIADARADNTLTTHRTI